MFNTQIVSIGLLALVVTSQACESACVACCCASACVTCVVSHVAVVSLLSWISLVGINVPYILLAIGLFIYFKRRKRMRSRTLTQRVPTIPGTNIDITAANMGVTTTNNVNHVADAAPTLPRTQSPTFPWGVAPPLAESPGVAPVTLSAPVVTPIASNTIPNVAPVVTEHSVNGETYLPQPNRLQGDMLQ